MLLTSAILSVGLLVGTYLAYRWEIAQLAVVMCVGAGVMSLGCLMVGVFPALLCQCVVTFFCLLVWGWRRFSANSFLTCSIIATVGFYGLFGYFAAVEVAEIHQLQKEYAFESMVDRAPKPTRHFAANSTWETQAQIDKLEQSIRQGDLETPRTRNLKQLHEETTDSFVNSPGFGVMRGFRRPNKSNLANRGRDEMPIAQPTAVPMSTLSETDLAALPNTNPDPLRDLHSNSILDFVNPRGFGYFVDRKKVAGFQPHHFAAVPKAATWKVESIELVGLLMNTEPVVYVSNDLPRMKKSRETPTRPLNVFETAGLKKIEEGDTLYLREAHGTILMLGAIRSADQCVKCHGGERGDLLGAFSYRLTRAP